MTDADVPNIRQREWALDELNRLETSYLEARDVADAARIRCNAVDLDYVECLKAMKARAELLYAAREKLTEVCGLDTTPYNRG